MTNKYLIVDDDDSLRAFLCSLFENDTEVFSARNGRDALDLIKTNHFQIIICDVNMPVMDGIEFCRSAMAFDSEFSSHLIMIAGGASKTTEEFCMSHDIPLINKPFTISTIRAAVKLLLLKINISQIFRKEVQKSLADRFEGETGKIEEIVRAVTRLLLLQMEDTQLFLDRTPKNVPALTNTSNTSIAEEERQILLSLIEAMLYRGPKSRTGHYPERRLFERKKVRIPALIFEAQSKSGRLSKGTVTDISFSGMCLSASREIESSIHAERETEELNVFFTIPETWQPIIVKCRTRRVLASYDEVQIGVVSVVTDFVDPLVLHNCLN